MTMSERLAETDQRAARSTAIRDQYEALQELLTDHVSVQPLDLAEVTTEAVYELPRPVRMVGEYTDHRLDMVRVRITRYPGATSEDDKAGEIRVEGYLRPMNRTGALRANGVPVWRRLPKALALPLISRALTQG
jgi:hypothetical protein